MPWTYVFSDLKGEEIVGIFYKKEWQKTKQKEFRIGRLIKRENDKVNDKGYDNSFNTWIDKKRNSISERIFSKTKFCRIKCVSWTRFV